MPATNYPNGVTRWQLGQQRHAWTNRPHPTRDDMHVSLCGAPVQPTAAPGLFNTDDANGCARCKVKIKMARRRWL